jgi:hypothetical protein
MNSCSNNEGNFMMQHDKDSSLDRWCLGNWNKLPEAQRNACLSHLEGWLPDDILKEWHTNGFDPGFHMFGGGMQIRNRLREVLTDDKLLPVEYKDSVGVITYAQNWDDYYTGALQDLMKRKFTHGDRS